VDKIEIAKNFPDCSPEELVEIQNYCAEMTAIQLVRFSSQYNEKRKNTSIAFWLNFLLVFSEPIDFILKIGSTVVSTLLPLALEESSHSSTCFASKNDGGCQSPHCTKTLLGDAPGNYHERDEKQTVDQKSNDLPAT
jgi:hypothetical protein